MQKLILITDINLNDIAVYTRENKTYIWKFKDDQSLKLFKDLKKNFINIHSSCNLVVSTHKVPKEFNLDSKFKIIIPHGSAFGSSNFENQMLKYCDIYCGHSIIERKYIKKCFSAKFIPTGYSANDFYYKYINSSLDKQLKIKKQYRDELKLPNNKKIVFISSHWTDDGILRTFGTKIIKELSKLSSQIHIVQGSHPNLWDNTHSSLPPKSKFHKLLKKINFFEKKFDKNFIIDLEKDLDILSQNDYITILKDVDNKKALIASDITIIDRSSIFVEASILKKPIINYIGKKKNFANKLTYKQYKNSSIQFKKYDEVLHHVKFFLEDGKNHKIKEQEKFCDIFAYNIGNATNKIIDVIITNLKSLNKKN